MTTTPKILRIALWVSPPVLIAGGFLASAEWLARTFGATVALLLAALVVTFVMVYAIYLGTRVERRLDEVQKAGAAFSAKWGAHVGYIAFVLLLLVPPFQALMTAIVKEFAADPGQAVERSVVLFSMALGMMGTVLLTAVGTIVMNIVWRARYR